MISYLNDSQSDRPNNFIIRFTFILCLNLQNENLDTEGNYCNNVFECKPKRCSGILILMKQSDKPSH